MPEYTAEVVAVGTLRLLDAIKTCGLEKSVKFYQASTSELFGKVQEVPQTEKTPFYPRQGPLLRYGRNTFYEILLRWGTMCTLRVGGVNHILISSNFSHQDRSIEGSNIC